MSGARKPILPKITKPDSEDIKTLDKMLKDLMNAPTPEIETSQNKIPKPKQHRELKLGTCYKNSDCREDEVLLRHVTKQQCKEAGGKSWKSKNDCELISD